MFAPDKRMTKTQLESRLRDFEDELNWLPTDEALREEGIPEWVIDELNHMGQHLERAIDLLTKEG